MPFSIGSFEGRVEVDTSGLDEAQARVRAFSDAMVRDFGRLGETSEGLVAPLGSIPEGMRAISVSSGQMARTATSAQGAIFALGQGIEDASFNIRFAANNLTQFIQFLGFARVEARAMGTTLGRNLLASLVGPAGLVVAISTLVALGPKLINFFKKGAEAAREMREAFKDSVGGLNLQQTQTAIGRLRELIAIRAGVEGSLAADTVERTVTTREGDITIRQARQPDVLRAVRAARQAEEQELSVLLEREKALLGVQISRNRLEQLGVEFKKELTSEQKRLLKLIEKGLELRRAEALIVNRTTEQLVQFRKTFATLIGFDDFSFSRGERAALGLRGGIGIATPDESFIAESLARQLQSTSELGEAIRSELINPTGQWFDMIATGVEQAIIQFNSLGDVVRTIGSTILSTLIGTGVRFGLGALLGAASFTPFGPLAGGLAAAGFGSASSFDRANSLSVVTRGTDLEFTLGEARAMQGR